MFSSTTIASSTTKPVEIVSAISDKLLRLNPSRYITPNDPMIEVGTATLGIAAARTLRRNANTTKMTSRTAITSVFSVSCSDCRMVFDRSTATVRSMSPGSEAIRRGSSARTPSTAWMMLAPGWRDRTTATPGLPLTRPALRRSSTEFDDVRDVSEPDRRAVPVGDHQIAILRRMGRLIVGVDLIVVIVVLDRSLRTVGVGGSKRGANVLKPDAVVKDRAGIDLDPHRRQRRARDVDLADARKLRKPLLEHVRGEVIELSRRMGRRRHGDDHDRRVGGIDLVIGRVLAQAGGQIDPGCDNCRLHVASSAVDIAIEPELERDAGIAEVALRGHLVDVGDRA